MGRSMGKALPGPGRSTRKSPRGVKAQAPGASRTPPRRACSGGRTTHLSWAVTDVRPAAGHRSARSDAPRPAAPVPKHPAAQHAAAKESTLLRDMRPRRVLSFGARLDPHGRRAHEQTTHRQSPGASTQSSDATLQQQLRPDVPAAGMTRRNVPPPGDRTVPARAGHHCPPAALVAGKPSRSHRRRRPARGPTDRPLERFGRLRARQKLVQKRKIALEHRAQHHGITVHPDCVGAATARGLPGSGIPPGRRIVSGFRDVG